MKHAGLIFVSRKKAQNKGELSDFKSALLPVLAALGGFALPALIHFGINSGLPTVKGFGIPMATDIAFALSVLALVGNRVPASLKVFLTAVAVIDDLCAVIVIAVFYTATVKMLYLGLAAVVLAGLALMNRARVMKIPLYLLGGALMWYFMLQSDLPCCKIAICAVVYSIDDSYAQKI